MSESVGRPDVPSSIIGSESSKNGGNTGFDVSRIAEVKAWLVSQFDAVGKDVPDFEYTPRSITHLHNIATRSQAKTQAATIVANDFRQKAAEYRSQAVRIREILEHVGLVQESLPSNVVSSSQVLANVSNLLNIRDTELSSFLVAMADLSLRKTAVEEKRAKVQSESKELLDYTRKAISRLTYLKRTLSQLEDEIVPCEAQMEQWNTNVAIMDSKERQYLQQYSNYKAMLNRVGYSPEISHGVLVEMAEHRKDLEKKTKPILDTLRSYQDLPPVLTSPHFLSAFPSCSSWSFISRFKILCRIRHWLHWLLRIKRGSMLLQRNISKMYYSQLWLLRSDVQFAFSCCYF